MDFVDQFVFGNNPMPETAGAQHLEDAAVEALADGFVTGSNPYEDDSPIPGPLPDIYGSWKECRALYHLQNHGRLQDTPSAASRVFLNEDIVLLVVEAFPQPVFPGVMYGEADPASKAARLDLYHLALTSTQFFHHAMRAAWRSLTNVQELIRVLYAGRVIEPVLGPLSEHRARKEFELLSLVRSTIPRDTTRLTNVAFQHFRFYAACPTDMLVLSCSYLETVLGYARRLLPPYHSYDFFCSLQNLVWVEDPNWLLPFRGRLGQFLAAPKLQSLSVIMEGPTPSPMAELDPSDTHLYLRHVLEQCQEVSHARRALWSFTFHAPLFIPIPSYVLLLLNRIKELSLQVCIGDRRIEPNKLVEMLEPDIPDAQDQLMPLAPRRLSLLWTPDSEIDAVLDHVSLGHLEELCLSWVPHYPSTLFLSDAFQFQLNTAESLIVLEISMAHRGSADIYGGQFNDFIEPLISRQRLKRVTIVLPGYSFRFSARDIGVLALAWPNLEVLNLSFTLSSYERLPNLQRIVPFLCFHCPRLEYLHLPGLATVPGEGIYAIPHFANSHLRHLSSDRLSLQHSLIDVALALGEAFPCLSSLGPHTVEEGSPWSGLHDVLTAHRTGSVDILLHHVAVGMQLGRYPVCP
ncbi:hypothetical protein C8Q77DRAFT_1162285 [Trametes polyzona]|nr:hypothetical protein C8Q77DRAFT_1162285 [Trametes polyzona]